ncbi:MAG: sulfurtransferase TusA family protein [Pseudomonadota bacterium]
MARDVLDCIGMKCPQPVLKIAAKSTTMNPGDLLEILGDCPTFESDVRSWCGRTGKTLLAVLTEGPAKRAQIQF